MIGNVLLYIQGFRSTVQFLQNENFRQEYMKNVERIVPLKRTVCEKNAKEKCMTSKEGKISFIEYPIGM